MPRTKRLIAVLAPSRHVSSTCVSLSGMCSGQNEMDRIVPRGFDFSPLGIIPPVLHSHFLSPELYQLLGASLKIYLKRKIKNTKLMMMTVKRFFTRNCLLRSVVGVTIPLWKDYCSNCFPGFNILLTVHHAMILGNCPT